MTRRINPFSLQHTSHMSVRVRVNVCACWFICVTSHTHMFHIAVWLGRSDYHFLSSYCLISSFCHPGQIYTAASPFSFIAHFPQRQLSHEDNETFSPPSSMSVLFLYYEWLVSFKGTFHCFLQVLALKLHHMYMITWILNTVWDFLIYFSYFSRFFPFIVYSRLCNKTEYTPVQYHQNDLND